MSRPVDRYLRCSDCHYPNLTTQVVCDQCGRALTSDNEVEASARQPKIKVEGLLYASSVGMGLLAGALVIVIAGVISQGSFLAAVASYLSRSMNSGRSSGMLTLFLIPILWFAVAPRLALPAKGELFDRRQVNVGAFASLMLTALLCAVSISVAPSAAQDPEWFRSHTIGGVWMFMPFVCQCVTLAASVVTWSRLDYLYGTSSDYEF